MCLPVKKDQIFFRKHTKYTTKQHHKLLQNITVLVKIFQSLLEFLIVNVADLTSLIH